MPTIRQRTKHSAETELEGLLSRLRASCKDEELTDAIAEKITNVADEDLAGRILRTNKGALMVRLSPTRWPIAMYREDWDILLRLFESGAIQHALDTMDILHSNPEKSPRQQKQERSVQIASREMIDEREEEEAA